MLNQIKKIIRGDDPTGKVYALIYCRVSSDRQAAEGHGLDGQELRCRQLAQSKGFIVEEDNIFRDTQSGGDDYEIRVVLGNIIKRIDEFPYRKFVVIADDLSRVARNTKAYLIFKEALKNRQVNISSPNFQFDDSPEGEYIEQVTVAGHEYQRKANRRTVIQKQKARAEAGYYTFSHKRGYVMTKVPGHGKLAIPDKVGLEMIKPALEGFANGTFIRKVDVARFLFEKGCWKTQIAERYIDKVSDILKDIFYAGYIELPEWEVSRRRGHHEALISLEVYELIQKRLQKTDLNKRIRIDTSPDFPLRGLIVHDACKGGHITAAWYPGRKTKYAKYVCHTKGCPDFNKPFPAKDVEDRFKKVLIKGRLKNKVDVILKRTFDRVWKDEVTKIKTTENLSEQEKRALEKRLSDLTDLMLASKSPLVKRNYEKQIEAAANEIEGIEAKSTIGLDMTVPHQTAFAKATLMLKKPDVAWEKFDVFEKQKLFFFLFQEKLTYSIKDGYQTAKIPYAARLFEDFATETTHLVENSEDWSNSFRQTLWGRHELNLYPQAVLTAPCKQARF
jgi:site-specific DNA recombinase